MINKENVLKIQLTDKNQPEKFVHETWMISRLHDAKRTLMQEPPSLTDTDDRLLRKIN